MIWETSSVRRITALFAGGVLALALFGSALAGPLEDGFSAYKRGDSGAAMQLLRPLADQGDAPAQIGLGWMYRDGRGVAQDNAQALMWLRKAADRGDGYAQAQNDLGSMYYLGQGVAQDYAQALAWVRKAVGQGNSDAQCNLGTMYYLGRGVAQDYAQAVAWYRKAAEQGSAAAQNNLGTMYYQGEGVPQDYVLAHMWFNLAASGAADASDRDQSVKNRNLAAAVMTPVQIAEAQRLAREWKPK